MWSNLCIQRDTECPIQLLYMSCFNDRFESSWCNITFFLWRVKCKRCNKSCQGPSAIKYWKCQWFLASICSSTAKRRRIGHQYTHKSVKQPEQKTLEISVVDFMAREEFVDENGIIPQVLPTYNLGKDDILFSGTVDLLSNHS